MFRRSLGVLALATLTLALSAAAPAVLGPPWISIEYPPSPYDQSTRDAFLLVHTFHHGTPIVAPVTGSAEGLVDGQRRSMALKFAGTSRTGVYALRKQWSNEGSWVLFITASQGPDDDVTAVVELNGSGQVAAVRVPTQRRGSYTIPADVSDAERETIVRERFAMNGGQKADVAKAPK
ncbi:MAG: hypothetical protein M3125_06170 [Gemmatimonadota bacterium]|nr:hypothetical protein [Gemmatimonadota bacterium]